MGVVSILEGAELLLKEGFVPDRDIYFAFGHDEEVGGAHGNVKVVKLMEERGIRLDYLVDEGGVIGDGTCVKIFRKEGEGEGRETGGREEGKGCFCSICLSFVYEYSTMQTPLLDLSDPHVDPVVSLLFFYYSSHVALSLPTQVSSLASKLLSV